MSQNFAEELDIIDATAQYSSEDNDHDGIEYNDSSISSVGQPRPNTNQIVRRADDTTMATNSQATNSQVTELNEQGLEQLEHLKLRHSNDTDSESGDEASPIDIDDVDPHNTATSPGKKIIQTTLLI